MLSFITSYLGTRPLQARQNQPAAATNDGTSRSSSTGGSGIAELHTDARLWEVQWSELTVLQRIGRGSFGSVYLAEWSHTQVAVKVLVNKGELLVGRLASIVSAILLCGCDHTLPTSCLLHSYLSDDVGRGQLELPERVLWELQAEAAVMSRMRHPK